MSIGERARASLILADYAVADAVQKLNLLGGGWQVTRLTSSGLTAPMALVAAIEVPENDAGAEFPVSIVLLNEAGQPVEVATQVGTAAPMRIAQLVKAERPNVPGLLLHGKVPSRVQVIVNFANGLPLAAGQAYTWNLEIDGHSDRQWNTSFYVAAPPQAVVG